MDPCRFEFNETSYEPIAYGPSGVGPIVRLLVDDAGTMRFTCCYPPSEGTKKAAKKRGCVVTPEEDIAITDEAGHPGWTAWLLPHPRQASFVAPRPAA